MTTRNPTVAPSKKRTTSTKGKPPNNKRPDTAPVADTDDVERRFEGCQANAKRSKHEEVPNRPLVPNTSAATPTSTTGPPISGETTLLPPSSSLVAAPAAAAAASPHHGVPVPPQQGRTTNPSVHAQQFQSSRLATTQPSAAVQHPSAHDHETESLACNGRRSTALLRDTVEYGIRHHPGVISWYGRGICIHEPSAFQRLVLPFSRFGSHSSSGHGAHLYQSFQQLVNSCGLSQQDCGEEVNDIVYQPTPSPPPIPTTTATTAIFAPHPMSPPPHRRGVFLEQNHSGTDSLPPSDGDASAKAMEDSRGLSMATLPPEIPPLLSHCHPPNTHLHNRLQEALLSPSSSSFSESIIVMHGNCQQKTNHLASYLVRQVAVRKCFSRGIGWISLSGRPITSVQRLKNCYRMLAHQWQMSLPQEEVSLPRWSYNTKAPRATKMQQVQACMNDFVQKRGNSNGLSLIVLQDVSCWQDVQWFHFDGCANNNDNVGCPAAVRLVVTTTTATTTTTRNIAQPLMSLSSSSSSSSDEDAPVARALVLEVGDAATTTKASQVKRQIPLSCHGNSEDNTSGCCCCAQVVEGDSGAHQPQPPSPPTTSVES